MRRGRSGDRPRREWSTRCGVPMNSLPQDVVVVEAAACETTVAEREETDAAYVADLLGVNDEDDDDDSTDEVEVDADDDGSDEADTDDQVVDIDTGDEHVEAETID